MGNDFWARVNVWKTTKTEPKWSTEESSKTMVSLAKKFRKEIDGKN